MAEVRIAEKFYKPKNQPALGLGENYYALYRDTVTGDIIAKYYNIKGSIKSKEEVAYKNGVWERVPGYITDVNEKVEFHNKVKTEVKDKVFPNLKPGEVKAAFVVNDAASLDIGEDGTTKPSANSGGLTGIIGEFLQPIKINETFDSNSMERLFPSGKTFKYPREMSDKQDKLHITQYVYKAPYQDVFTTPAKDVFSNGIQRGSALKKKLSTVILPMPNGASDANSVGWGEDTTGSLTLAAAGDIGKVATTSFGVEALSKLADIALNLSLPEATLKTIKQAIIQQQIGGNVNNPTTTAAIQAAILKAAGYDVSAETILARGFGVVSNSNLELLFNGPTLRGFTFQYRMSPRGRDEAADVRKIIRYFKQGMAVKKANATNGAGAGSFLLATPNVFKLRYQSGDDPILGINKFKICALTNCNVTYAPEGKWAAYEGGQPVSYTMQLTFKELEPVYESDYQEKIAEGPKSSEYFKDNYEVVTDDDIGY